MASITENIIKKNITPLKAPNLVDYNNTYKNFDWEKTKKNLLHFLPNNQGLNIAYEAIDRHCFSPTLSQKCALRCISKNGDIQDFSYDDMRIMSNRFAHALVKLKIKKDDSIFCLCPRIPELYFSAFGIFKNRSIFCPLFSVFGPEPILQRMKLGDAKVLITTESMYLKKIQNVRNEISYLKHIILIPDKGKSNNIKNVLWWDEITADEIDQFTIEKTNPEDIAIMHFTSGTTGTPKAALHAHHAVLVHKISGQYALDIHPSDIFWCTADPGWVTGTSYGIISPLTIGATNLIVESDFNAIQWLQILKEQKVNIWYTAPTAIRMLMRSEINQKLPIELEDLRFIASVGEPLNPEAILWGLKAFKLPIHDNWWQTETGGIMISNYASMAIKPGSMGKPLPGIEVEIVEITANGNIRILSEEGAEGMIALKKGWPSMFKGYLHQEEKYINCFEDDFYLTGDLAKKDNDGYFWFIGRSDDVIKTAGHLIGPFEVESVLMEHPAVAEAAMIGIPDEISGNTIKAFVVLKNEFESNNNLRTDIMAFIRKKLGPAVAPKEITFIRDLPKTRSGKIMRRLLRARELNLPEGDISTLWNQE